MTTAACWRCRGQPQSRPCRPSPRRTCPSSTSPPSTPLRRRASPSGPHAQGEGEGMGWVVCEVAWQACANTQLHTPHRRCAVQHWTSAAALACCANPQCLTPYCRRGPAPPPSIASRPPSTHAHPRTKLSPCNCLQPQVHGRGRV